MSDEPTQGQTETEVPPVPPVDDTPPAPPSSEVPPAPTDDTPPVPPADEPGAGGAAEEPTPVVDSNESRTGFVKNARPGDECICPDGRKGTVHKFDEGLVCIPNVDQG